MLEEGSLTAHVVIVARAMSIPVLGRVRNARGRIREGDTLLLDGDFSKLTVRPAQGVLDAFEARFAINRKRQAAYAKLGKIMLKIGYPSTFRDYGALVIARATRCPAL